MKKDKLDKLDRWEKFSTEINARKPKKDWLILRKGIFEYFVIKGVPKDVWFIKNTFRRTYIMKDEVWEELDILEDQRSVEELQLEFEKKWDEGKLDFNKFIEKEEEVKELKETRTFLVDEDEDDDDEKKKKKKRKFLKK